MKNKKIWIPGGIILLVIILAMVFKKDNKGIKISTEKVSKRTITEIVSVSGKIKPESEVKISADVSGEIIEMMVKEGDSVLAGQLLLKINPDIYVSSVSQLQANLDNGKAALASSMAQRESTAANLMQAEANFKRIQKLWEQKVSSDQELEQARLQYETAKASLAAADKNILAGTFTVKSLTASLEQGTKNLGRTNIYAPASGIITNLNSEKGERVVGTAQMAGTEIMRVSNLNSMEVEVNVNENDIVRIKNGDSADIRVDAYPDRTFKGVVTEIANSAKFEANAALSDQATNYVVKVHINPESYSDLGAGRNQPFKSGMNATVNIRTKTSSNVLSIPISSVTTRNPKNGSAKNEKSKEKEESKTWVFVYSAGIVKAVEVKTGIQDINYFELLSGVKEGDEVVSEPGMAVAKDLNDGDRVQKVDHDKVFSK